MSKDKSISIEKAEKISSLIRNAVLIIGAVITAVFFLQDNLSDQFSVRSRTLYINGETTNISYAEVGKNVKETKSGRLGTISRLDVRNKTQNSVSLEIRIPGIIDPDGTSTKPTGWPVFSLVAASPSCPIDKKEIQITNSGVFKTGDVGAITIAKFPADCALQVDISSTQISESSRFMHTSINVFYDGKKAKIKHGVVLYGLFAEYIDRLEDGGLLEIVRFLILPLVLIFMLTGWIVKLLIKLAASRSEEEKSPEKADKSTSTAVTDVQK
jgi:hypothetical protein